VPDNKLVVLLMHIPLLSTREKSKIFRLIEQRPFTLSVSGHQHYQRHLYVDDKDDWRGEKPHHHVINVTAGGSWWKGMKKYGGIPHAYSRDGTPNGYSVVSFDGNQYSFQFKAAGRPADYQMHISAPNEVPEGEEDANVYVNIFSGSAKTVVTALLRNVKGKETALPITHTPNQPDPDYVKLFEAEEKLLKLAGKEADWIQMSNPTAADHLWRTTLPGTLKEGLYTIEFQATQPDGTHYTGLRSLRIVKPNQDRK